MRDSADWMLSDAIETLQRAERLYRQFFRLYRPALSQPTWEPPVDMLETEREVLIFVALPGVPPERVEAAILDDALVVAGSRSFPPELRTATIHRLELPQGRFERRIGLPPGRYQAIRSFPVNGYVVFSVEKASA
jgi:HSP20 family protein